MDTERNSTVCNLVFPCSVTLSEADNPFLQTPALDQELLLCHPMFYSTWNRRVWGSKTWLFQGQGEKPQPRHHHFILTPPSHSLILLMKPGQAEACSRTQQFHFTIWASHIEWRAGRRGRSVGSTARRKERWRKYTTLIPGWIAVGVHWYPVIFCLLYPPFSFTNVPVCLHRYRCALIQTTLVPMVNFKKYKPGTHTKWWWA